jgi:hypothetical protein
MYDKNDIPGFLKQVYRFGIYKGFEERIEKAISWHETRHLPDARAWRLKFRKVFEQVQLAEQSDSHTVEILQEEQSLAGDNDIYIELTPISRTTPSPKMTAGLPEATGEDRYVVSQISRSKMERANQEHANALAILAHSLRRAGYEVGETKLIDAFSIIKGKPVIFEIKSINKHNERTQVRHAISQLYEYRYLYDIKEALLCLVFSQQPFSKWLIDYLIQDRSIHVLWIENGQLAGLSFEEIIGEI